jgi:hypothetical protein
MQSKLSVGQVLVKVRSAKQLQASQENGRRGKGPVSEMGKRHSSMNALKHGGYSDRYVPVGQNPEHYRIYAQQARQYWKPCNAYEEDLVRQYIFYGWKLQVQPILENAILSTEILDYYSYDLRIDYRKSRKIQKTYLLDQAKSELNKSDELLAIAFKRDVNSHQSLMMLEEMNSRTFAKFQKVVDRLEECQKRRRG